MKHRKQNKSKRQHRVAEVVVEWLLVKRHGFLIRTSGTKSTLYNLGKRYYLFPGSQLPHLYVIIPKAPSLDSNIQGS